MLFSRSTDISGNFPPTSKLNFIGISLVKNIFIIGVVSVMAGCSAPVTKNIDIQQSEITNFNIPSALVDGKENIIPSLYANGLLQKTQYKNLFIDAAGFNAGTRSRAKDNTAYISYVKESRKVSFYHNLTGEFHIQTKKNSDYYSINVTCPTKIEIDGHDNPVDGIKPFISPKEATADLQRLCKITPIVFTQFITGEINTDFNDSSVFANFKRKLKSYDPKQEEIKQYDLGKSTWFYISDKGQDYKVAISVFPYRNGSKVTYKTTQTTTCNPSTTCIYDADLGNRINDAIKKIAND